MKLARTIALGLALAALAALISIFVRRVAYPYDLEWMEGGVLCHALRIASGQPTYAPPSVDFVPFLYTPLYPALLAGLAKVGLAVGYGVARSLSFCAFAVATLLGYVFARREGGSRACAFAAMALPAAAFATTGAWYDLARPDSLSLLFTTAGLLVGWWKRRSHLGVAVAAGLLVLAFFAKQTAAPFMIALGAALVVANWRVVPAYVAALALFGLPALWLLNRASSGWFWTYVFQLHQQHDFYPIRAFVGSPIRLLAMLGPGALLVPWAIARRSSPGLRYAAFLAVAGAGAACIGFGTQWAFTNAFIPGVFFASMAMGLAAGRLVIERPFVSGELRIWKSAIPRLRPAAVYLALALSLALAPGALLGPLGRAAPVGWGIDPSLPTGYQPGRFVPTADDRARGGELIARLRATPGEVLLPFHPFYAHLAGKPTYLHGMGVLDVGRAGLGLPRGFAEALASRRFALVIMDKLDGNWSAWPGLLTGYHLDGSIAGPRTLSGAPTQPRFLFTPASVVDREP